MQPPSIVPTSPLVTVSTPIHLIDMDTQINTYNSSVRMSILNFGRANASFFLPVAPYDDPAILTPIISKFTGTTVALSWLPDTSVTGGPKVYDLYYRSSSTQPYQFWQQVSGTTAQGWISGTFNPHTPYYFSVVAKTRNYEGYFLSGKHSPDSSVVQFYGTYSLLRQLLVLINIFFINARNRSRK